MDHHDDGIDGGKSSDQQQGRIAEAVGQPAAETALLPLDQLVSRDQHHHEGDEQGPQRRGLSENEIQYEADGGELHPHAHGGNAEADGQAEPEGDRDRAVDDQQQGRQRQIRPGELYIAHAATRSTTGALPLPGSTNRAWASRTTCPGLWLTRTTMRPDRIWNLMSSSASAVACASRAEVGSSSKRTRGSSAMALTSPNRWRSPV